MVVNGATSNGQAPSGAGPRDLDPDGDPDGGLDDARDHPAILAFTAVGGASELLERKAALEREIVEIDARIAADRAAWEAARSPETFEELCLLVIELRAKLALAAPEAAAKDQRARNEKARAHFLSDEGYELGYSDAEAGKPAKPPRNLIKGHYFHGYMTGHADKAKGVERRGAEAAAEYVAGLERGERRASGAALARAAASGGAEASA